MKSKVYIFFFLVFFLNLSVRAQYCDTVSFQKIIWNKGIHNAETKNIFFSPAGNIYIIGSTESAINYSEDIWIMKTTPGGNVLWSKTIGMQKDEIINGIKNTSDGGFIIAGSTNSVSTFTQGWVVKTDSNAVIQWSFVLGTKYSNITQVTQLYDGNYAVSGILYTDFTGDSSGNIKSVKKSTDVILKIDKNGNAIWWKSFRFYNREALKAISQSKDSSLFVTGAADSVNDGYVIKLSQANGNILWMNEYNNVNQYSFPRAIEQPDKTIHLHVGNRTFFLTAAGKFFDGRQTQLNSKTLNLNNVQVADIGLIAPETEMYQANLYPQHAPIIFAVKNDSVVVWAHQYQQTPDKLQRMVNGRIYKSSIYLAGDYITDNLSDNNSGENLTYLIKADANGSTLCSDTFNVSFKIDAISYPPDMTHTWINEGSLEPYFVSPYTETIAGDMQDDCAIQNCCKTVVSDTTIFLCNGSKYNLPPNDSLVTTSGLYRFNYFTWGGCDSILNYHVNFNKLYNFHLDDTCLINNQPVTFSLPSDSTALYKWQDGSALNNFTATVPGKYWVTATSACNIFRDTVNVSAVCSLPVYIPSAFTPNNDGLNDVFEIRELNGQRFIGLSIYNRYGKNIFFSENAYTGWSGTINGIKQPSGTYIYIASYFDLEGISHTLKGTVVLIR